MQICQFMYMWWYYFLDIQDIVGYDARRISAHSEIGVRAEPKSDRTIIPKKCYSTFRSPGTNWHKTD